MHSIDMHASRQPVIGLQSMTRGEVSRPPLGCLDSVDWNDGMERWNGLDWTGLEWNGMNTLGSSPGRPLSWPAFVRAASGRSRESVGTRLRVTIFTGAD